MEVERGVLGRYPFAAMGIGGPVVVLAGLSPTTGVHGTGTVRAALGPLAALAKRHRLVLLNRRERLPRGMTMAELATEHAEAIRLGLATPVDVVGTSTGGSIAQQLAADHADVVRRLVLVSTACRLGPEGRRIQRQLAARVRAGARRQAFAVMAAALVPPGRGRIAAGSLAWLVGPWLITDPAGLDDMATVIEAEDEFDLAPRTDPGTDPDPRRPRRPLLHSRPLPRDRATHPPRPLAPPREPRPYHGDERPPFPRSADRLPRAAVNGVPAAPANDRFRPVRRV